MRHLLFSEPQQEYPIAIVTNNMESHKINKYFLEPFGLAKDAVVALELFQKEGVKKTPVADMTQFITDELAPILEEIKAQYVLCTDSEYFKKLTGVTKVQPNIGYVLDSPFGSWKVIYLASFKTAYYDPDGTKKKIEQAITALKSHVEGTYIPPGSDVLKQVQFPKTYLEIELALANLLAMDCPLAIDIEAFSLKHYSAGIGSIAFAWDENSGIAFSVDYRSLEKPDKGIYGEEIRNEPVRALLKKFFKQYKQTAIYHNITYDASVLIYQLFMKDLIDTEGLLEGIDTLLCNWDDTKLITYLATNSAKGNELGLKDQAQEHAGNYAEEDIKDIRKIPEESLLKYNLTDSCSTWFTFNKNQPIMIQDQQEEVYKTIFKPAAIDIIQMQLTGMPIDMSRVKYVKEILHEISNFASSKIAKSIHVQEYAYQRKLDWVAFKNETLKKKRVTLVDAEAECLKPKSVVKWNPNSNTQLKAVLYDKIGLPVIETTDTGLPSTDGDTLAALRSHTKDPAVIELLNALLDYAAVNKLISSFIPAMETAQLAPDGWHYLFGNFNLGGTVSGRLSSSDPK